MLYVKPESFSTICWHPVEADLRTGFQALPSKKVKISIHILEEKKNCNIIFILFVKMKMRKYNANLNPT